MKHRGRLSGLGQDQATSTDRVSSRSSVLGLDALNFLMADVRDGIGPYLSIYLKGSLHWQSGEIGIAMAVSSITAAICQIPAGLLVDSTPTKRLLVVIAGLLVGLGTILVVCVPKLVVIVDAQAVLGAASAVIPPALAALSLGLVGHGLFPARVSRNESFNHAGNFTAATLAGTVGQRFGYRWIFRCRRDPTPGRRGGGNIWGDFDYDCGGPDGGTGRFNLAQGLVALY